MSDAVAHLAGWVAEDAITLAYERHVDEGVPVSFRVALEDDASVIEGVAECRSCVDLGDDAPPNERYAVVLGELDLDARSEAMWNRIRAAAAGGTPLLSSGATPIRPLSGVSSSPGVVSAPMPPREGPTRVVSLAAMLRSEASAGRERESTRGDATIAEAWMLPVNTSLRARATEFARRVGESRSVEEITSEALRIGLAVLEEQAKPVR